MTLAHESGQLVLGGGEGQAGSFDIEWWGQWGPDSLTPVFRDDCSGRAGQSAAGPSPMGSTSPFERRVVRPSVRTHVDSW